MASCKCTDVRHVSTLGLRTLSDGSSDPGFGAALFLTMRRMDCIYLSQKVSMR